MHSAFRIPLLALAIFSISPIAQAANDNAILESRLERQASKEENAYKGLPQHRWQAMMNRLSADQPAKVEKCADARLEKMAGKYAVSFDERGLPCRIYDLAFPTLETLFSRASISKVPVQSFRARDYLNWMDGDYEAVLHKMEDFRAQAGPPEHRAVAGWVRKLRFKQDRLAALQVATVQSTGLPASFTAADFDVGSRFQFTAREKAQLQEILSVAADHGPNGLGILTAEDSQAWQEIVQNPEVLLAKIKFEWNDLEKVYDVFIQGEFLPIRGPIALVDYSASYKLAVERLLRSLVHSGINKLIGFIPGQARAIVSVVVNDAFLFVEIAYDYQLNQLEGTLREARNGTVPSSIDAQGLDRGMNILFGGRSDVVTQYIMAVILKKPFDWNQFENIGRSVRHGTEKQRDIMLNNLYSEMVQKKGCEMTLTENYFGVCSKNGKRNLHSLISQDNFLFWRLGGPLVYRYDMPSYVFLKRSASYILAVGASMLDLPILNRLTSALADGLRTFATAGMEDEAFLRNALAMEKFSSGSLDEPSQEMLKWLHLQNINPFLTKTEAQEARIIAANAALLKMN